MAPLRTTAVALALLLTGFAGCLGTGDAPAEGSSLDSTAADVATNETVFVNPDGRGVSAAANETNKTVVGKGGIEHLHDYWEGQTERIIVEEGVYLGTPVFCDNRDTSKIGCAEVRPPVTDPATLVYEGTGRLEVLVTEVAPTVQGLEMSYRNGANPTWSAPVTVTPGTPIVIELSAIETDMPHSYSSQWAWRFVGKPAILFANPNGPDFKVTVTVFKSDRIANWPGHPDFYADRPYRVVMDKDGVTKNAHQLDQDLYGDEANIVRPDLLISSGTGNLTLYLNITGTKTAAGDFNPDRYYIDYTNATGYWNGAYTEWNRAVNRLLGEKVSENQWVYRMPVDHNGWDSPYAPTSGWQFLVRPGLDGAVVLISPQFMPYEVNFHLTIIAEPDPQYLGIDAAEGAGAATAEG